MSLFIASFFVIFISIIAMGIGVILGRPAIKGSCGGLNNIGLEGSCRGICSTQQKQNCPNKHAK